VNHVIFFLASVVLLAALSLRARAPSHVQRAPTAASMLRGAPPPAVAGLVRFDASVQQEPRVDDASMRARLRDRYIEARFPGVLSSSADLADADGVVTIARLLFEEGRYDDAQELLQLAIGQSGSEPLRLARLEITFLQRDASRYVALARELRQAHPQTREWTEVARLGRLLVPGEALFGADAGQRPHDRYGPWPDMPNWIQASWDLTPEVLAAELHRDMRVDPSAERARELQMGTGD
jgi:hypothetical protein